MMATAGRDELVHAAQIARVLEALRAAGFPGSVQRRESQTVRRRFRNREHFVPLETAIPVGPLTWIRDLPTGGEPAAAPGQPILTGITEAGNYVDLRSSESTPARLGATDCGNVLHALEAHARLHGVVVPATTS